MFWFWKAPCFLKDGTSGKKWSRSKREINMLAVN